MWVCESTNIKSKKKKKNKKKKTPNKQCIKNMINNRNKNTHIKSDAGVYAIQYLGCNKKNMWVKPHV